MQSNNGSILARSRAWLLLILDFTNGYTCLFLEVSNATRLATLLKKGRKSFANPVTDSNARAIAIVTRKKPAGFVWTIGYFFDFFLKIIKIYKENIMSRWVHPL